MGFLLLRVRDSGNAALEPETGQRNDSKGGAGLSTKCWRRCILTRAAGPRAKSRRRDGNGMGDEEGISRAALTTPRGCCGTYTTCPSPHTFRVREKGSGRGDGGVGGHRPTQYFPIATLHLDDEPPSRVRAIPSRLRRYLQQQLRYRHPSLAHLDPLYRHTEREARAGFQGLSGSGDMPRLHST